MFMKKLEMVVFLVALLIFGGVIGLAKEPPSSGPTETSVAPPAGATPQTQYSLFQEGVLPDDVFATVNGKPIPKDEILQSLIRRYAGPVLTEYAVLELVKQ